MEPLQVLIGEGKMGQAGEKTLAPLPGTRRALKHPFLTSVKPSPVETRALPRPLCYLSEQGLLSTGQGLQQPPGSHKALRHMALLLHICWGMAASLLTRDAQQRWRCAAAAHGYLWLCRESFRSPGFWAISPNSIRLWC